MTERREASISLSFGDDRAVTIEGTESFVVEQISRYNQLFQGIFSGAPSATPSAGARAEVSRSSAPKGDDSDLKAFFAAHERRNEWENIMLFTYFYQVRSGSSEGVTLDDVARAYELCGRRCPSLRATVNNLKYKKKLIETSYRGRFKLNEQGVAYIDGVVAGDVPSSRKGGRKAAAGKKSTSAKKAGSDSKRKSSRVGKKQAAASASKGKKKTSSKAKKATSPKRKPVKAKKTSAKKSGTKKTPTRKAKSTPKSRKTTTPASPPAAPTES